MRMNNAKFFYVSLEPNITFQSRNFRRFWKKLAGGHRLYIGDLRAL